MKISIAMATYNGAEYVKAQLDSFAAQSRLPDELIVCDDASSDSTMEILQNFARSSPFDVRVVRNEKNLGFIKNFQKSLSFCNGDIIFLSDQDDVWFSKKLERVESIFKANTDVMVIINDQEITDKLLNPSGLTAFSNTRAMGFDYSGVAWGCCTAIRRSFREVVIPVPEQLIGHDVWIHRVANVLGVRMVFPEVLQYFRRHGANASAATASKLEKLNRLTPLKEHGLRDATSGWLNEIALSTYILSMVEGKRGILDELGLSSRIAFVLDNESKKIDAIKARQKLLECSRPGRLYGVLRFYQSGNYRFFSGWKSALKDVIR